MNETVKKVDIYCREKNFIKLSSYCKFIIIELYADIEFNSRYWIWPQDTEFELNEDVDVDENLDLKFNSYEDVEINIHGDMVRWFETHQWLSDLTHQSFSDFIDAWVKIGLIASWFHQLVSKRFFVLAHFEQGLLHYQLPQQTNAKDKSSNPTKSKGDCFAIIISSWKQVFKSGSRKPITFLMIIK